MSRSEGLYKELIGQEKTAQEVAASDVLNKILTKVSEKRKKCKVTSRTAALWLQYMDMLDIVRTFIKAERNGKLADAYASGFTDAAVFRRF